MTAFENHNIRNAATTAMHMYDGMVYGHSPFVRLDDLIDAWHSGWLELTMELAQYAVRSERRLLEREDQDFPGVYDYEVSVGFGLWFGDWVLEHGNAPAPEVAEAELDRMIEAFFTQGKLLNEQPACNQGEKDASQD